MKTFQVYKHPIAGIEAIKVGFSFPAFFFGWIWMFIKYTIHQEYQEFVIAWLFVVGFN